MHMYNSTTDLIFILKGDRKSNQIIRKDYLCMLIVSVVTAVYIFLFVIIIKKYYNDDDAYCVAGVYKLRFFF